MEERSGKEGMGGREGGRKGVGGGGREGREWEGGAYIKLSFIAAASRGITLVFHFYLRTYVHVCCVKQGETIDIAKFLLENDSKAAFKIGQSSCIFGYIPSMLYSTARVPVAQMVRTSDQHLEDAGSNPGWISFPFFFLLLQCPLKIRSLSTVNNVPVCLVTVQWMPKGIPPSVGGVCPVYCAG